MVFKLSGCKSSAVVKLQLHTAVCQSMLEIVVLQQPVAGDQFCKL